MNLSIARANYSNQKRRLIFQKMKWSLTMWNEATIFKNLCRDLKVTTSWIELYQKKTGFLLFL